MRYIKKDDHYLDTKTGFMWSLNSIGPLTWDSAMRWYPSDGVWRLPTIEELITLVDYDFTEPATELPDMRSFDYWSATDDTYYVHKAWSVYFHNGYDSNGHKSLNRYVRAIRG